MPTRRGKPGMMRVTPSFVTSLNCPLRLAARSPGRDFLMSKQEERGQSVGSRGRAIGEFSGLYISLVGYCFNEHYQI